MQHLWAGVCALLLFVTMATAAAAQHTYTELNFHGGALFTERGSILGSDDDTEADPMAGVRLARHSENGWGIGGNFDWIFSDQLEVRDNEGNRLDDVDLDLFLYSVEVDYTFPSSNQTNFFVGAGIGGATERLSDVPPLDEDETDTDVMVPIFVGLKIHNRAEDPSWAIRIDARDNIIWREELASSDNDSELDNEANNNFEISAGISFFFGGGPSTPPPPPDADGDGVFDNRDQCPNTAFGVRVDSFGCAVPIDSDGDGVPDDRDQCPGSPVGEPVDEVGCPPPPPEPEPEPVVSCADGRDWYRFNDTISFDGRNWVKFGSATTIAADELNQIGEYDGVPVLVHSEMRQPYTTAYVPLCATTDAYQPYQVEQGVRGTTG